MTLANELGHSNQNYWGDDVKNILEEEDRPLTLDEIAYIGGIDMPDVKRAVAYLEADDDVVVEREHDDSWLVTLH